MKQVVRVGTVVIQGQVLPICANSKHGCFVEILERTKDQMDAMLSHHSKILVIRFDLHVDTYQPTNALISKFVRKLRKKLTAKYKLTRIGYIWAREQEKAKRQHYHFALIVDANKIRYPKKVLEIVDGIWQAWLLPKPYTPRNCYYLVKRGDTEIYQEAFYRLSYLAKTRGKGYKSKTANDYSASRIAHKQVAEPVCPDDMDVLASKMPPPKYANVRKKYACKLIE